MRRGLALRRHLLPDGVSSTPRHRPFSGSSSTSSPGGGNVGPSHGLRRGKLPPFWIVDTTLREGEQFATADFSTSDRVYIAKTLDRLGVDYLELANPAASPQALADLTLISKLGLKSKVLTHTRCALSDVQLAIQSGCSGVNIYMATSPILAKHSHGKAIDEIAKIAEQVIGTVKAAGLEARFSCEDTFRSNMGDVLGIYKRVCELGVDRVGIADTVGISTAYQVYDVVSRVREVVPAKVGIEFHVHNDTGGCIANALEALEAGATHIDTCVLGIGERNGITPLGGFLARLYTLDREQIMSRYNLKLVAHIERFLAQTTDIQVPFNNYVTGSSAFTHKAGVHTKAVLNNPAAYEIINPQDFDVSRRVQLVHRLTGWNVIAARARELDLDIPVVKLKALASTLKTLSESRQLSVGELDSLLISLASPPREHSAFLQLSDKQANTAHQMRELQQEIASAVNGLGAAEIDTRPSITLQFVGHLFDKAVLNMLLDVAVESGCEFKVLKMEPGKRNDVLSRAVIRLTSDDEHQLAETRERMHGIVKLYETSAQAAMHELGHSSKRKPRAPHFSQTFRIRGHLFDKAIFNRMLDILVLSGCDFDILNIEVPSSDELPSVVDLELSTESKDALTRLVKLLRNLIDTNHTIAATEMWELQPTDLVSH
eukprot:RCo024479